MIVERQINIFNSSMQTITNTVNTVGVMGKGLAKEFKNRYPDLYVAYQIACEDKIFDKEGFFVYQTHDKRVLCFPTKQHWINPSKLEWIDEGLYLLSLHYHWYGITSLSLPPLGCSNGGLDFKDVKPLMYKYFADHPLEVEVILPY